MTPKFFGKSLEVSGGIGNIIRPIFGQNFNPDITPFHWKDPPSSHFLNFEGGLFISTTSFYPKFRFSHFEGGVFSRGVFLVKSCDRFCGQYRPLWKNRILCQKSWFLPNLMNHNMVWNLAGIGLKIEICLGMCSPGSKDTSEYLGCKRLTSRWYFLKHQKNTIFDNFEFSPK